MGFGLLVVLLWLVFRPHLWVRDQWTLHSLETQLSADVPRPQRVWTERFQTGSGGGMLFALALVPDTDPLVGVHVFRLGPNGVIEDQGLYEGQVYDPDCHSCAPHSIAVTLQANPGQVVWARHHAAAWFD